MQSKSRRAVARRRQRAIRRRRWILLALTTASLVALTIFFINQRPFAPQPAPTPSPTVSPVEEGAQGGEAVADPTPDATPNPDEEITPSPEPTPTPEPTPSPTPEVAVIPDMPIPAAIDGTRPSDFLFETKLNVGGKEISAYTRAEKIEFGPDTEYTGVEGITTFRGNNYRNTSSYGTAEVNRKKLSIAWTRNTSSLGKWTGSGWTGQPIIMKWPEGTRRVMNLVPDKKDKDGLIEVIYPMMNGYAYFFDIEDGKQTRERLKIDAYQSRNNDQDHMGGASIDPRGYPLLYVGSGGDKTPGKDAASRFIIFSLIDYRRLHEFGKNDPFAPRKWTGWDCAPLIDAKTDTLIECGENGLIYTMKLNTAYDEAAGTISIAPNDVVKLGYTTDRSRRGIKMSPTKYWLGMESSSVIWKNYLYIADNGGNLLCVDLNTMTVIWVHDTLDDTNCSPVFEQEADGRGYLYISTSYHEGWRARSGQTAPIPIWKVDASTGEVMWERTYECYTTSNVSGGVQATALVGQGNIADLVFVPVARTPKRASGILVALDKKTGEEVWRFDMPSEKNGGYS